MTPDDIQEADDYLASIVTMTDEEFRAFIAWLWGEEC
jgi:hypothetical protein